MGPQERQSQKPTVEQALRMQVDNGIRELLTEMQQGKSDRLEKYFEFSACFHRYSVRNQFLIYLQRPQATFVAGYRKWQEWGYQVGRGEKGIRILAPRLTEKQDPDTKEARQVDKYIVCHCEERAERSVAQSKGCDEAISLR